MQTLVKAAAAAALATLSMGAAGADPLTHDIRLDHPAGSVDARYRGTVEVAYRQLGAAGAPGRASSLRCGWSADLRVDREARATSGARAARSFDREAVLSGSRPGWCATSRAAIADEVAARGEEVGGHLRALAAEDRPHLAAHLERAPGKG